jgi:uncharacterized protein YbjT (DUF2867 family)
MRVFVTGGTGAIGKYAVPALVGAGHTVSTLVRGAAKASAIETQGATPVLVSMFDRDALAAAFANHDAVINLASALPSLGPLPDHQGKPRRRGQRSALHRRSRCLRRPAVRRVLRSRCHAQ